MTTASKVFREVNGLIYFDDEPVELRYFMESVGNYTSIGKGNLRFFAEDGMSYVIVGGNQRPDALPKPQLLNYLSRGPYIVTAFKQWHAKAVEEETKRALAAAGSTPLSS